MSILDSKNLSADRIDGRYFDGRSTRPSKVFVSCDDELLHVSGEQEMSWPLVEVSVSERLGRSQRRLLLPDGAFIEVADSPMWDGLPQQWGRSGMHLAWLEERWRYVLGALALIIVSCALLYVYALPWAAERIAERIPPAWVSKLSTGTMDLVDRLYTEPSKLPAARQKQIADDFAHWVPASGQGPAPAYQLHFRNGVRIGPNAFALPSGDIVITDQLIALARDDKEILGVLAHELGHQHKRHALRQLMQSAMLALAANVFLGDMGDMTGTMAAVLSLRYSRDFEREADDYAAAMMKANHVDPTRLADMLQHLDPDGAKREAEGSGSSYFMTHPITAERIKRLQQAR